MVKVLYNCIHTKHNICTWSYSSHSYFWKKKTYVQNTQLHWPTWSFHNSEKKIFFPFFISQCGIFLWKFYSMCALIYCEMTFKIDFLHLYRMCVCVRLFDWYIVVNFLDNYQFLCSRGLERQQIIEWFNF